MKQKSSERVRVMDAHGVEYVAEVRPYQSFRVPRRSKEHNRFMHVDRYAYDVYRVSDAAHCEAISQYSSLDGLVGKQCLLDVVEC